MSSSSDPNPYAPPLVNVDAPAKSAVLDDAALASAGARLGASLLDGLVYVPSFFVMIVGGVMLAPSVDPERAALESAAIVVMVIGGLLTLALYIFQLYRVTTTGQTLGKKWLDIRIVKMDGTAVTFSSAVLLRSWVAQLINAIPYIGWIFGLVDILFIFREDRRCLHDHIAGTRVVETVPLQT